MVDQNKNTVEKNAITSETLWQRARSLEDAHLHSLFMAQAYGMMADRMDASDLAMLSRGLDALERRKASRSGAAGSMAGSAAAALNDGQQAMPDR